MTEIALTKRRKPWLAALLSLLTSGLGQIYNGQLKKGVTFLCVGTVLGVVFAVGISNFTMLVANISIVVVFSLFVAAEAFFSARKKRKYTLQSYNKVWMYILVFAVNLGIGFGLEYVMTGTTYQAFKVPSESMLRTLYVGDHFIAEILSDSTAIERGEVVVFEFEGKRFVKRVIGLPGDVIAMKNKTVSINGKPLDEPYARHTIETNEMQRDTFGPLQLGTDEYFCMGDNRQRSYDSRWIGPIKRDTIFGRAKYIYFPGDSSRGFDRLGMDIR